MLTNVISTLDHKILCLGLIQSLFEGSMFMFVLEWTPALSPPKPSDFMMSKKSLKGELEHGRKTIPHGYVFADLW